MRLDKKGPDLLGEKGMSKGIHLAIKDELNLSRKIKKRKRDRGRREKNEKLEVFQLFHSNKVNLPRPPSYPVDVERENRLVRFEGQNRYG